MASSPAASALYIERRKHTHQMDVEANELQGRAEGLLPYDDYQQALSQFKSVYRTPWERVGFWESVLSRYGGER